MTMAARDRKDVNPLMVQEKLENFYETDVYPMLHGFPRAEKHALCLEIKQSFGNAMRSAEYFRLLSFAKGSKEEKLKALASVDCETDLILMYFNFARSAGYIRTDKKLYYLQEKVREIGRMVGGLINKVRQS